MVELFARSTIAINRNSFGCGPNSEIQIDKLSKFTHLSACVMSLSGIDLYIGSFDKINS